jgi:hypothetical protein
MGVISGIKVDSDIAGQRAEFVQFVQRGGQSRESCRFAPTEDLAGLRHLSHRLGACFVAGYVLYTGQQMLSFGDRLRAIPLDALWQATP